MNILVVGGNSFLGKSFLNYIEDKGFEIFITTRSRMKDLKISLNNQFICDLDYPHSFVEVFKKIKKIDVCINFIGASTMDGKPSSIRRVNLDFAIFLHRLALRFGVKKFIQFSTSSVYHLSNKNTYMSEKSTINPLTPYSKSKLMFDNYLASRNNHKMKNITFRLPLVYGPNGPTTLPFIINSIKKKRFILFGGGTNKFNLLYVQTLNKIILNSINSKEVEGLFQLSDKKIFTLREFVDILSNKMSVKNGYFVLPLFFLQILYLFSFLTDLIFKKKLIKKELVDFYSKNRIYDTTKFDNLNFIFEETDIDKSLNETIGSY